MSKHYNRRLWLQLAVDADVPRRDVVKHLIQSIRRGDYRYPREWRVAIGWSNKPDGHLKWGEFTREMIRSSQSSVGFDSAVMQYLENQL